MAINGAGTIARRFAVGGVALSCALLFILQMHSWPHPFALTLEMETERATRFYLLYDVPPDAAAPETVMQTIDSRGRFKTIRFPIRSEVVQNIRLMEEPGGGFARLRLMRIEIPGRRDRPILPTQLAPINRSAAVVAQNDVALVGPSAGGVGVQIDYPLRTSRFARRTRWGIVAGLGLMSATLLLLLRRNGAPEISPKVARKIGTIFIALVTALFLFASGMKINGSTISLWRYYADRAAPDVGVLFGMPKDIRSDEWMVQTPWIMSQAARAPRFPANNPVVGENDMALLNNLPVRHWSALFRPQMWGFFIVPFEYAFAFYWNFKWFGMLLGGFLFLRTICLGRSVPAVFGTLLLYFSPFIQWWFSTPTSLPEMLGMFFFGLWAVTIIQRTSSRVAMGAASVLLVIAVADFIFCSYPRFQVPLLWLVVFLIAGYFAPSRSECRKLRKSALFLALGSSALLLICWFREVAPLISAMAQLAYPGHILGNGGGFPWRNFAAPFLDFAATQEHFRKAEMNVCNASGFLFLAPAVLLMAVLQVRTGPQDRLTWALILYSVFLIVFMHFGLPVWLAKWTGFSRVYAIFANLGVAVASLIALCRILSLEPEAKQGGGILLYTALASLLVGVFYATNEMIGRFVNIGAVVSAGVFFSLVFLSLYRRHILLAVVLLLPPLIDATALINPVVRGLSGISGSNLFRACSEVERHRPEGSWIALGHSTRSTMMAHLLKATGATVVGGTRCTPDAAMRAALDPAGKNFAITNRFAWISFEPGETAEPSFVLTFISSYRVLLPLDPAVFDRLHVSKILEVDLLEAENSVPGFISEGEYDGCRILVRQKR